MVVLVLVVLLTEILCAHPQSCVNGTWSRLLLAQWQVMMPFNPSSLGSVPGRGGSCAADCLCQQLGGVSERPHVPTPRTPYVGNGGGSPVHSIVVPCVLLRCYTRATMLLKNWPFGGVPRRTIFSVPSECTEPTNNQNVYVLGVSIPSKLRGAHLYSTSLF